MAEWFLVIPCLLYISTKLCPLEEQSPSRSSIWSCAYLYMHPVLDGTGLVSASQGFEECGRSLESIKSNSFDIITAGHSIFKETTKPPLPPTPQPPPPTRQTHPHQTAAPPYRCPTFHTSPLVDSLPSSLLKTPSPPSPSPFPP